LFGENTEIYRIISKILSDSGVRGGYVHRDEAKLDVSFFDGWKANDCIDYLANMVGYNWNLSQEKLFFVPPITTSLLQENSNARLGARSIPLNDDVVQGLVVYNRSSHSYTGDGSIRYTRLNGYRFKCSLYGALSAGCSVVLGNRGDPEYLVVSVKHKLPLYSPAETS